MQKLQDSVFSIIKTTNLSPAVFSFLQPSEDSADKKPLGGILKDTRHGWLALGSKLCIIDLKTGLKVAATTFGSTLSNLHITITCVVELTSPLTTNSRQLIIGLKCENGNGMICIFHINGSQILRCIQTDMTITHLSMCNEVPDGPFACFDGVVIAGTRSGEIIVFDLNRNGLMQALKNISQGYEHLVSSESKPATISFLPMEAIQQIEEQRELALENDHNIAVIINEDSLIDGQYIYRNPDGTVRMKAKRDHVKVSTMKYIPQLGSLAVGYNFGAFQMWNIMTLELEFSSQVNVECLPVTHFGFQEPCDDPRAFCYLWVVFSVIDQFEEEDFPLAVMYSLTYQGKRMMPESKCLYQEFLTANIRFQMDLSNVSSSDEDVPLYGGRCLSCYTYSVNSNLGEVGEDSVINICHIVWECMVDNSPNSPPRYGMMLFDLDQWYKDQMPASHSLESNAFMSANWCPDIVRGGNRVLDMALEDGSVCPYSHATRLEEHFYPNSLQYNCVCLTTSDACVLSTIGIQRQIISSLDEVGPTALLNPPRLYNACLAAGLTPLYMDPCSRELSLEDQRSFLLSVALEARLSRLLKRCAHDWAAGTHASAGCTLTFLVDWCWKRAITLKENAKELTAPLFTFSALPDRNVVRCLEHCVQQLTQLTGLLDAVLTKCCNLIVPDALSEIEEKYKGIGTVSLYFQVTQWLLRVGLLPERQDAHDALPYPAEALYTNCAKRRLKLHRLQDNSISDETAAKTPCALLYIDQLIEQEFGGDRVYKMWLRGGSLSHGLYPPPSLYSLLRLYLLPDIAEEHKHSLLLYLLVDYSMIYDEVRYETVTRKLMQFPTMFGLSTTAIKSTLAFWHLDHREFDIALDQLQCLTGNTLSEWQHRVVLSSLLAQKKTQAALQYLHVRKPAPIQTVTRDKNGDISLNSSNVNDHDKLNDWQSCCSLYLARRLIFEALDVIRMCVQNAGSLEEKTQVLNYFFKGCRNTGQLCKILEVTLLPFEEQAFVKYLQNCNEDQTSDILIMYYLQQARYLEAQQYNNKIKHSRARQRDMSTSLESLTDVLDRDSARDTIVDVVCSSLPTITSKVAHCALHEIDVETRVIAPKPMSVYIQAKSPKNTFTYKSSFIQETIENASETWINKPTMRRGIKRALNIEETPFICTPKLTRTVSVFSEQIESTPAKRAKLDFGSASKSAKRTTPLKVSDKLSQQMALLLEMPEVQSPDFRLYERSGAETPHSILKIRRAEGLDREAPSPVDSRYLGESDDEVMENASNHTHYSDTANKHLRFIIPTPSESDQASPIESEQMKETERPASAVGEKEMDATSDSFVTTTSRHAMDETHPLESPPKKLATDDNIKPRKSYKDTVRARRSLSISANSSLSDDPNASVESIADIPITLINPRYSGERRTNVRSQQDIEDSVYEIDLHERKRLSYSHERLSRSQSKESLTSESNVLIKEMENRKESSVGKGESDINEGATIERVDITPPRTPRGRRGIRNIGESTPLQVTRSRSVTPERYDSPIITQQRTNRATRSRSRTPEVSPKSSPLDPILEQPIQESETEQRPFKTTLNITRQFRSRSRTPERSDKTAKEIQLEVIVESPKAESPMASPRRSLRSRSRTPERTAKVSPQLEVIPESPAKTTNGNTQSSISSPSKRSLRSRSRTPEIEILELSDSTSQGSPRSLRSRSKTPERPMSPKPERSTRAKKPLSRIVLEANALAAVKQTEEKVVTELTTVTKKSDGNIDKAMECTPKKPSKQPLTLMDVTFSPIVNKSVLQSPEKTIVCEISEEDKTSRENVPNLDLKTIPTPSLSIDERDCAKSVLHSYESSVAESPQSIQPEEKDTKSEDIIAKFDRKSLPAFTTINETFYQKSVLHSYQSTVGETSHSVQEVSISVTKESNTVDDNSSINIKSVLKDVSSIITSDSDVEMRDDNQKDQWKAKIENQDTANVIRKEKEKIVEIEREINEIEGDMSYEDDDDQNDDESGSSGDEEIIQAEEESMDSESSEEDSTEESTGEIISINDSDTDASSQSNTELQIDEQTSTPEVPKEEKSTETGKSEMEAITEVNVEKDVTENDKKLESSVTNDESTDPLNQGHISLMTDDNSVLQSDESDICLHYSDESKIQDEPKTDNNDTEIVAKTDAASTDIKILVEEVDSEEIISKVDTKSKDKVVSELKEFEDSAKTEVKLSEILEIELSEDNKQKPQKESDNKHEEKEITLQPAARTRKRVKSTSSTKSVDDSEKTDVTEVDVEKLKTPKARTRTDSTASNKSCIESEQKTPEEVSTPSRRRSKTPQETRLIVTRRVSKEIAEKMDISRDSLLDDSLLTPKRRATRSRSKNIDDNTSIASEGSVKSTKSKTEDGEASYVRKNRKSAIAAKPHLSVIPENTDVASCKVEDNQITAEYSASRKLTRHQQSILESKPVRRVSTASRASSMTSNPRDDDDDKSSTHSTFDVQPIDRISLLNKQSYEGSFDAEEFRRISPVETVVSDSSKQRRSRFARAASETKALPKVAKAIRRVSVDIPDCMESPVQSGGESPARTRRASFNRAIEALHTPKGRRTSTDLKRGESDSQPGSPTTLDADIASTPTRRQRRTSTASNQSDAGKRSKK